MMILKKSIHRIVERTVQKKMKIMQVMRIVQMMILMSSSSSRYKGRFWASWNASPQPFESRAEDRRKVLTWKIQIPRKLVSLLRKKVIITYYNRRRFYNQARNSYCNSHPRSNLAAAREREASFCLFRVLLRIRRSPQVLSQLKGIILELQTHAKIGFGSCQLVIHHRV